MDTTTNTTADRLMGIGKVVVSNTSYREVDDYKVDVDVDVDLFKAVDWCNTCDVCGSWGEMTDEVFSEKYNVIGGATRENLKALLLTHHPDKGGEPGKFQTMMSDYNTTVTNRPSW